MSGGRLTVDTDELDALIDRLRRAEVELATAGDGVADLGGVSGLAVGAQAVFDALADLSRQWLPRVDAVVAEAEAMRATVTAARERYVSTEQDVLLLAHGRPPDGPAT